MIKRYLRGLLNRAGLATWTQLQEQREAIGRAYHAVIVARVTERYRRGRGVVPVQASRWWE